jgi:hypothetical protein
VTTPNECLGLNEGLGPSIAGIPQPIGSFFMNRPTGPIFACQIWQTRPYLDPAIDKLEGRIYIVGN